MLHQNEDAHQERLRPEIYDLGFNTGNYWDSKSGTDCAEEFYSPVRNQGPEFVIGTEKSKATEQVLTPEKTKI